MPRDNFRTDGLTCAYMSSSLLPILALLGGVGCMVIDGLRDDVQGLDDAKKFSLAQP